MNIRNEWETVKRWRENRLTFRVFGALRPFDTWFVRRIVEVVELVLFGRGITPARVVRRP